MDDPTLVLAVLDIRNAAVLAAGFVTISDSFCKTQ